MAETAEKAPAPSGGPGVREDPIRAYDWKIQIDNVPVASFVQCCGLEINVDTISFPEGGNLVERKVPGRVHYPPIRLEKGLTQSKELWDWLQSVIKNPPVQRKTVSILMLQPDGVTERLRWNLYDAWPCGWRAEPLNAASSLIAILSLELAYESLDQD